MDRKNLGILLTALILILAVFLGMELADTRHPEEIQVPTTHRQVETEAPTTEEAAVTETTGSTLPPNMLPIG